jgi:hypothetical protein
MEIQNVHESINGYVKNTLYKSQVLQRIGVASKVLFFLKLLLVTNEY